MIFHYHYFPNSVSIKFPASKRNLIYIMTESMEINFKEYSPEINRLSEKYLSFAPWGIDACMTNWTMGAKIEEHRLGLERVINTIVL